ncbi:DUF1810 domain-containing protein [uncultured Croceicoccus sp.]|uniref:DUF1810 domain-containing protein n=1 Tax=uncultured Croceicoccus sp. TaxID=1295329 RepID=UPI0026129B0C|nr:DUF1810 domain-containing protein [uncultured Croceicoccus sp.]
MSGSASALTRFVEAQDSIYERALGELRDGAKRSHWMWFVFPQIAGLGHSAMARRYAIADAAEARAYLRHDVLGPRLIACTDAVLDWAGRRGAVEIMGEVDAMKLRSSMTLFEAYSDTPTTGQRFGAVIDAFYDGQRDAATRARLGL